MHISQLETPVAIVDLDKLEANILGLQRYLDEHGIVNRPHIKTHKIPEIAHMQIKAGAVGITCQKLSEAELMAQAGIRDILITYNIIGEARLERLMNLTRRVCMSVTADSEFIVQGLSTAAQHEGTNLTVLIEFDTGLGRCGVQTPQEAAALAKIILRSPGLIFGGLMTYPHNENTDPFVRETKALLSAEGITVQQVSLGSTSVMRQAHTRSEVTEYRAGVYVYGDRAVMKAGAMRLEDCALSVISTVVSRPTPSRGILDAGSKALSSDILGVKGHGLILEYPKADIFALHEEHGLVDFSRCERKPQIGERVTVIPNHCCVVSNLFNQMVGVRNEKVELVWQVTCRSALQ